MPLYMDVDTLGEGDPVRDGPCDPAEIRSLLGTCSVTPWDARVRSSPIGGERGGPTGPTQLPAEPDKSYYSRTPY